MKLRLSPMPKSGMDRVRQLVKDRIDTLGLNMAKVSRGLGQNHAYIQQYIKRGTPRELPEAVRHKLAPVLQVTEIELRPDYNGELLSPPSPPVRPTTGRKEMDHASRILLKVLIELHGLPAINEEAGRLAREVAEVHGHPQRGLRTS